MERFLDEDRLVYIGKLSDSKYWDEHWASENFESKIRKIDRFVVFYTKKFLKKGANIVEGGCGRGDKVYSLQIAGYNTVGVDYAEDTIEKIKKNAPELNVLHGDIREMPFQDEVFDGYWSLGVIEHFYDGYDLIASEMYRVLKKNGYLFITVPAMSPLRRLKAFFGAYRKYQHSKENQDNFYQFVLSPNSIIKKFESFGFGLEYKTYADGIKGLKDEVGFLKKPLQKIYDSNNFFLRVARKALNLIFSQFSGHIVLLVLKKAQ